MYNYNKTKVSPYDPAKLLIQSLFGSEDDVVSTCGQKFEEIVSFDDIVHFIDDENIVTYVDFDRGISFYPETPTNIRRIKRELIYISISCEKTKCIPHSQQRST